MSRGNNSMDMIYDYIFMYIWLQVTLVLSKYTDILKSIAHSAKPDLDKVIDKESQLLNKTILSNRRCYCELNMRLHAADIERERKMHDLYNLKNAEWKKSRVCIIY